MALGVVLAGVLTVEDVVLVLVVDDETSGSAGVVGLSGTNVRRSVGRRVVRGGSGVDSEVRRVKVRLGSTGGAVVGS